MNDKLLGLQLGADDYVTKPFNYAELILLGQEYDAAREEEGGNGKP